MCPDSLSNPLLHRNGNKSGCKKQQVHRQFACRHYRENPRSSAMNKLGPSPPDVKPRNSPDIIAAVHDSPPAFFAPPPKLFWAELITAVLPLIKLFVLCKAISACPLLLANEWLCHGTQLADWRGSESRGTKRKGSKTDLVVADFLTSGAESCQFAFVNRQLCGSRREKRGGCRQHRSTLSCSLTAVIIIGME